MQWAKEFKARGYQDWITHIELFPPDTNFIFMAGITFSDPNDPLSTNDEWFMVVDSMGCDVTNCWNSIDENSKNQIQFSVYPNPSSGEITLEISDLNASNLQYIITDINGRKVDQFSVNSLQTSYSFEGRNQGVYVVHLVSNGVRVNYRKLVLVN